LASYLLFPKLHVSILTAITIGKIWSNTLLRGLNSREGQRANWRDSRSTPESDTIQSIVRWWQRNPPVRDDLGMELADMGRSGNGSAISSLVFEQDTTSVQITEEKANGEVGDHQPTYVLFGEQPTYKRAASVMGGAHLPLYEKVIPRRVCLVAVLRLMSLDGQNQIWRGMASRVH